jgi:starch phosphorylase
MKKTRFAVEIRPRIPEALIRLEELADNLWYSWNREVRHLFFRLDGDLWNQTGHNPKLFLRLVDQHKLESAALDPIYMQYFGKVLFAYDGYLKSSVSPNARPYLKDQKALISYSCAEFGLHESFPIYSGGLGILAGDHCKAASDLGLPFVAFGILYRQGYFKQRIDYNGNQVARYTPSVFSDLPVRRALDENGNEVDVTIELDDRNIHLAVWVASVGNIPLYLLDSDIPSNNEIDRQITHYLYGGDSRNRLLQEIVLGIGGVKAHRALGLAPTVWHINEGHAAFQILERARELVVQGLTFEAALETVAANTVFTTHTPVPAGHDYFSHELMTSLLSSFVKQLDVGIEKFLALGISPANPYQFNMTALALRGSRFQNGVSKIHGRVASSMEAYVWPQILPEENPIASVTNGVHLYTFLANEWINQFDQLFGGGWRKELLNGSYWEKLNEIPDYSFWSTRQVLKTRMLVMVRERLGAQILRNGSTQLQIDRVTRYIKPRQQDALIIGFARRFATYKRAALILTDKERLAKLLNNPQRPVVIIIAGKAHPNDLPAQEIIRVIHEHSCKPEFEGRLIVVEDYDIALARELVAGVDVWLNNPAYPMEASGTSGQKAGMNGVLNLSILDGWWDEGYNGCNGWAISPHSEESQVEIRDHEEARELLDLLEYKVIPLYFERDTHGYSPQWIQMSKNAMKSLIPNFNSERMVLDYLRGFYTIAMDRGRQFEANHYQAGTELARWKAMVHFSWPRVKIEILRPLETSIYRDQSLSIDVAVDFDGMQPSDIQVECLLGTEDAQGQFQPRDGLLLNHDGLLEDGRARFTLSVAPMLSGRMVCMLRAYPWNPLLTHRFEMGYMLWL